ncbi:MULTISPECIES: hypothetical protein [unclassified Cryobacterium]|uniref:hypothetical protein n=1 Tax=unclassified Cryobacterium TaxID=2649013 RepID=UPI002AB5A12F|nr:MULTISPECIES: hypothetical protein [unclassified Cryobacterium]MDY7542594.1 hypothetical protein [Cryobacterium sp. 5B3]MEB0264714.1 hypothetical protein [Cryobacterium sp. 10I5]MEB0273686.1 hypothetical protein [Cryobacterium sp. 5B3]
MSELAWVATDLKTGRILADLPGLVVPTVKATLGRYESAQGALPLPTAPENWERATLEGASVMNLLIDGEPDWGGMVTEPTRSEGAIVPLNLATLEAYFDRRYVGDELFTQVGQNVIVKTLVEKYAAAGPLGGVPFRVQFTTPGNGKLRDLECKDANDKTLYSTLTDLMGLDGGPEWTVGWERQHNPERITPVLYVGDRIGIAPGKGLGPAATFEMPGCVSSFVMVRSFANGRGANCVVATSTASGDARLQSPAQLADDPIRPTFEHRWTPSTSIKTLDNLIDHALAALRILEKGSSAIALSADADTAPDGWGIGDDIGFVIGGVVNTDDGPAESVPSFPGGIVGTARCIGWERTLSETSVITPTLFDTTIASL